MSRHAKTTTDKFLLIDDVVSKVKNGRQKASNMYCSKKCASGITCRLVLWLYAPLPIQSARQGYLLCLLSYHMIEKYITGLWSQQVQAQSHHVTQYVCKVINYTVFQLQRFLYSISELGTIKLMIHGNLLYKIKGSLCGDDGGSFLLVLMSMCVGRFLYHSAAVNSTVTEQSKAVR